MSKKLLLFSEPDGKEFCVAIASARKNSETFRRYMRANGIEVEGYPTYSVDIRSLRVLYIETDRYAMLTIRGHDMEEVVVVRDQLLRELGEFDNDSDVDALARTCERMYKISRKTA